ncbi:Nitroreductase [Tepidanaerobacter acetatoxydans Re1]|uniref:Nitroreductase n=1 Tax=Tepidanaerobacter acetatoxydans (strain DSM 21804 / JCM 16047 / Re1) TaxID=1209989 RepID=F4LRD9_TEPAE|nr:nitroreductase family protein [Tepidanaerobacter acetatoxydans]AEE92275.1 nitroreductase [Tepidanaerobacter acetatoxydans Re1]CCP27151.1 Nitroreductase [Tepidanaerobacter acetatoxydans Re1]
MEELYNSIFRRKSIRKYDVSPLPPDTLSEIKQYASNVKPLVPTIKTDFSYLTAENVKNPLPIKAPHYICIYSEKAEHYLMNAGFMLQQVDLYLSAKSIGSCWLGMAKPASRALLKMNGMDFVIMLAFGNAAEPLHRASISEFKRKAQNEISTLSEASDILNAVRLAPSATNSQPWFFTGNAEKIQVHRVKLGIAKAAINDKFNQIDIGIALCHLYIAASVKGKNVEFLYDKSDEDKAPKGYEYMMTAVLY